VRDATRRRSRKPLRQSDCRTVPLGAQGRASRSGSRIRLPYSCEVNDSNQINYRFQTGEEFGRIIKNTFDVLYAEGADSARVMAICLHPFMSGVPHRIRALDEALAYVKGHDRVWFATGEEIVRAYFDSKASI
jgi:peptidoglycan/xylan/chitin deacetylase (PgdA/CDA1 family)